MILAASFLAICADEARESQEPSGLFAIRVGAFWSSNLVQVVLIESLMKNFTRNFCLTCCLCLG